MTFHEARYRRMAAVVFGLLLLASPGGAPGAGVPPGGCR